MLLALNHFLGFQADWSYFAQDWKDEYKFYLVTEYNQFKSISQIYTSTYIDREYLEYAGYIFYISSIASIAHSVFDGNSLLLQLLGTAFFGISTSVVLFNILRIYFNSRKSFSYTLLFMFFSAFNSYSYVLLRDVHIAFFYTCGLYLFLSRSKNKTIKLILLLLLNFLLLQLRFEHGLFFSIITLMYIINSYKKNRLLLLSLGLISIIVFVYIAVINYDYFLRRYTLYSNFTEDMALSNNDSFGKYIYQMPPVIKHILIVINSQIQPFPSWLSLLNSQNIYIYIEDMLIVIYSFYWYCIFSIIFWWGFIKRKITFLDGYLKVIGIICLAFLFLNTSNMNIRRIIAFYPFIFLVSILIKEKSISKSQFKNTIIISALIYLLLIIFYLILKTL